MRSPVPLFHSKSLPFLSLIKSFNPCFLTLLLSISPFFLHSQALGPWKWQNPYPQGLFLYDNFVLDENRMVAVGRGSTILRTEDGGHSWKVHHNTLDSGEILYRVEFFEDYGWAAGLDGSILRTTDGGKNWSKNAETSLEITGIEFIDRSTGWIVGSPSSQGGVILHTEDGGNTWTSDTLQQTDDFNSIHFLDDSTGWVSDEDHLYRTLDGGTSWDSISNHDATKIQFATDSLGWTLQSYIQSDRLFRTEDGGASWTPELFEVQDFHFLDDSTGVAVHGQNVYKTVNAGKDWWPVGSSTAQDPNFSLFSIHAHGDKVWSVGESGYLFQSSDGGGNWVSPWKKRIRGPLNDVDFPSPSTGYICGSDKLIKTDRGGNAWSDVTPDGAENMVDLSFIDEQRGWALQNDGVVHRTNDGGNSWEQSSIGNVSGMSALQFLDQNTGYAVGASGTIAKTVDGGIAWSKDDPGNHQFSDLHFTDPDHGWAGGHVNMLYRTRDGGENWEDLSNNFSDPHFINCVHFENDSEGWVAGAFPDGVILHTSNGGDTWTVQDSTSHQIEDLHFTSPSKGWALEDRGTIHFTDNGGSDWEKQKEALLSPYENPLVRLTSIDFPGPGNGWAVGENGAIFHFSELFTDLRTSPKKEGAFFSVHPNPVSKKARIEWGSPEKGQIRIFLYDAFGNLVRKRELRSSKGKNRMIMDVEGLASGIYFLRAKSNTIQIDQERTEKLIVR